MLCAVLCWVTPWPWPSSGDGYVLSERHGSGSPLLELPPRSVYLCTTDSACSAALFASHVELLRPDLIVAPAQHLWDRAVLRKLATTLRAAGVILPDQEPRLPRARAAFADAMLRQLVAQAARRPVFFEGEAAVRQAMPKAPLAASLKAPFMVVADKAPEPERAAIALAAVDAQVHARFGSRGPRTPAARDAWFDAYDVVGKGALLAGDNAQAVASFRRAISLDPKRSTGFSNLGVALEARGELSEAFAATRRALEIDPSRATAWVNLARLSLRAADLEQTRKILVTARRVGVQDRRLDVMERELQGSTGK
jgi:tetratricopeptide (TPR) repeat protein